jgi:hypothetical protein
MADPCSQNAQIMAIDHHDNFTTKIGAFWLAEHVNTLSRVIGAD